MLDIVLLRIMKRRQDYMALIHSIPAASLDQKTKMLLDDFGKYFNKFEDHPEIDLQVFLPRFKLWHPGLTEDQFMSYVAILRNISKDVDDSTRAGILSDLYEVNLATQVANICSEYDSGSLEFPLSDLLASRLDEYKINIGAKTAMWEQTPIEELLLEESNNEGLRWRLGVLNEHMRPLRPGDFGIIAGRPDKGKTSFLCSEMTFMAGQLPEDKNVLWLNNEGLSKSIKKRLYQSALGKTIGELVRMENPKKILSMYEKLVGRLDRIRIINIHGFHVGQVEAIIERSNPGIILYDMIDNIRGFGSENRTDLQLEKMYQWARERAVKYECIGLATSQISAEGEGLQYPGLSMLKDSKTGKQGACDFQLMIGASSSESLKYSRFISLPKNKLRLEGVSGDPHCEVSFRPDIARYEEIEKW